MDLKPIIEQLWSALNQKDWDHLKACFCEDAAINWNNTNERLTVEEFVSINRTYPGDWTIKIERLEQSGSLVISVIKVEGPGSFHAVSFFEFEHDKIKLLNEYWGDDSDAPEWRLALKIGKPIHP